MIRHRALQFLLKFMFLCFVLTDFAEERRHLLEMVGPELQSQYDQMGLEVSSPVRQTATALGTQSYSYTVKFWL
jgi:hypothetical protein